MKFLTETHPYLIEEWDFVQNSLKPNEVSYGSKEKIFWICNIGHSWQAKPNDRVSKGSGCPYCKGRKASQSNRLDVISPEIAKIFDHSKNSSKIEEFSFSSHKKIFVICSECNFSFEKSPNKLQYGSLLCEKCNGSELHSKNRRVDPEYLSYCDEKIIHKNKKGSQTSKYWLPNRLNILKSKAGKRKSWQLTDQKAIQLISGNCYYCGDHEFKKIGIDRKDNSIDYLDSNCVSCCWFCNSAKSDKSIEEFKALVSKIYEKQGSYISKECNFESILKKYKTNAARRGIQFSIADSFALEMLGRPCNYCGETAFGIDRVDPSLDYCAENSVPCCKDCNFAKLNFSKDIFLSKIEKIYRNMANF